MCRRKIMSKGLTKVDVEIVRESDRAYYVTDAGFEEAVWIPKSQIFESSQELRRGITTAITIPIWLAKDKGLVGQKQKQYSGERIKKP
jgi:hypothetical protein